jgi:hypothetical protein
MAEFPRTAIEGLSVSRLIMGTNWFLGFSHQTRAKDRFIKSIMTSGRIADVMEVFLRAGVDTLMGFREDPVLQDAVACAQDRVGRRVITIATPHLENLADDEQALGDCARVFDRQAELGADVCMPHQCTTDALVDRRARTIHNMDRYCRMIRRRGMIPGLSTHMPETPVYADETALDVATYIQIYNAIGFLMPVEVDWVHGVIQAARRPVIAIKPMAAGRLHPLAGMAFVWSTIRDRDMVAVGTQTPDEARELIELSWSLLLRRRPEVPLQWTRSKASVASAGPPRPAEGASEL